MTTILIIMKCRVIIYFLLCMVYVTQQGVIRYQSQENPQIDSQHVEQLNNPSNAKETSDKYHVNPRGKNHHRHGHYVSPEIDSLPTSDIKTHSQDTKAVIKITDQEYGHGNKILMPNYMRENEKSNVDVLSENNGIPDHLQPANDISQENSKDNNNPLIFKHTDNKFQLKEDHRELELGKNGNYHAVEPLKGAVTARNTSQGFIDQQGIDIPFGAKMTRTHDNSIMYNSVLDVPQKFLKIPSSSDKMEELIKSIEGWYPCIKGVKAKKGNKLYFSKGSFQLSGNDTHANEAYIELCKGKSFKHSERHHNKEKKVVLKPNAENSTVNKTTLTGIRLGTVQGGHISSENEFPVMKRKNKLYKVDNDEPFPQGISSQKLNLINTSNKGIDMNQDIDTITNYGDQFVVSTKETNSTPKQTAGEKGLDFITSCNLGVDHSLWTRAKLENLIDADSPVECWQAEALREIYYMEQLYHKNDHSHISTEEMKGVEAVMCYLLSELLSCIKEQPPRDKPTETPKPNVNPRTTVTHIPATSKIVKVLKTDKTEDFEQMSNDLNLDWEANMLFY